MHPKVVNSPSLAKVLSYHFELTLIQEVKEGGYHRVFPDLDKKHIPRGLDLLAFTKRGFDSTKYLAGLFAGVESALKENKPDFNSDNAKLIEQIIREVLPEDKFNDLLESANKKKECPAELIFLYSVVGDFINFFNDTKADNEALTKCIIGVFDIADSPKTELFFAYIKTIHRLLISEAERIRANFSSSVCFSAFLSLLGKEQDRSSEAGESNLIIYDLRSFFSNKHEDLFVFLEFIDPYADNYYKATCLYRRYQRLSPAEQGIIREIVNDKLYDKPLSSMPDKFEREHFQFLIDNPEEALLHKKYLETCLRLINHNAENYDDATSLYRKFNSLQAKQQVDAAIHLTPESLPEKLRREYYAFLINNPDAAKLIIKHAEVHSLLVDPAANTYEEASRSYKNYLESRIEHEISWIAKSKKIEDKVKKIHIEFLLCNPEYAGNYKAAIHKASDREANSIAENFIAFVKEDPNKKSLVAEQFAKDSSKRNLLALCFSESLYDQFKQAVQLSTANKVIEDYLLQTKDRETLRDFLLLVEKQEEKAIFLAKCVNDKGITVTPELRKQIANYTDDLSNVEPLDFIKSQRPNKKKVPVKSFCQSTSSPRVKRAKEMPVKYKDAYKFYADNSGGRRFNNLLDTGHTKALNKAKYLYETYKDNQVFKAFLKKPSFNKFFFLSIIKNQELYSKFINSLEQNSNNVSNFIVGANKIYNSLKPMKPRPARVNPKDTTIRRKEYFQFEKIVIVQARRDMEKGLPLKKLPDRIKGVQVESIVIRNGNSDALKRFSSNPKDYLIIISGAGGSSHFSRDKLNNFPEKKRVIFSSIGTTGLLALMEDYVNNRPAQN